MNARGPTGRASHTPPGPTATAPRTSWPGWRRSRPGWTRPMPWRTAPPATGRRASRSSSATTPARPGAWRRRACASAASASDRRWLASALASLRDCARRLSLVAEALAAMREALAVSEALRDPTVRDYVRWYLAALLLERGKAENLPEARELARAAVAQAAAGSPYHGLACRNCNPLNHSVALPVTRRPLAKARRPRWRWRPRRSGMGTWPRPRRTPAAAGTLSAPWTCAPTILTATPLSSRS